LASENNLEIVSFTMPVPTGFQGMVTEPEVREAVALVHRYNQCAAKPLRISLTFTIGTHNADSDSIAAMLASASEVGADFVRFNRFIDTSETGARINMVLPNQQNADFYARLDEQIASSAFRKPVMISSDFGTRGSRSFSQSQEFSPCPGGRRLFSILGDLVYPCVEVLHTPVGEVVSDQGRNVIRFDPERLSCLADLVRSPGYDGCIGYSMCSAAGLSSSG